MKKLILTIFSVSCSLLYSQQNLFNIPSGDITPKGKVFYQHQLNVYEKELESKGHFVYGLGSGWDAGLNLIGKKVYFNPNLRMDFNDNILRGSLYPFLMATAQKQFHVRDNFDINIGTQVGVNLSNKIERKELAYFNYILGVHYFMDKKARIVGGAYQTNEMFVGEGNKTGIMLGYEIRVAKNLYLMGDWMSGNNDSSSAIIGGMYNIGKRTQLCLGALIPNPKTPKPYGVVLEINLLGWDLDHD